MMTYTDFDNFEFLDNLDKEDALLNISALHLCRENSPFAKHLSRLILQTLLHSKGSEKCSIKTLTNIISKNFVEITFEDPQEYLFVDCVHINQKTYRVFPGVFSHLQYDIKRIFTILRKDNVKLSPEVHLALFLLNLSDLLAEKMSYQRYDIGCPNNEKLFVPNNDIIKELLIYDKKELEVLLEHNGCDINDISKILYRHDSSLLKEFDEQMNGFSIIEQNPIYKTSNGKYLILQPSALLTAASCIILQELYNIYEDNWSEKYKIEVIWDILNTKIFTDFKCIGRSEIEGQTSLLFRVDKDKLLCIQTIINPNLINQLDLLENVIRNYVKIQFPQCNCHIIFTVNYPGFIESFITKGKFNSLIIPLDELITILNTNYFTPLDLVYYLEDRFKDDVILTGQEIDIFAFYYKNKKTFYINSSKGHQTFMTFTIGNALQLRYDNLYTEDLHYIEIASESILVERFIDFSTQMPIYIPYRDFSKCTIIAELKKGIITCSVNHNKEYHATCWELSKSIIIWLIVIEKATNTPIIYNNIISKIALLDIDTFELKKVKQIQNGFIYKFYIPYSFVNDYNNSNNLERTIIENLLGGLKAQKELISTNYFQQVEKSFQKCKGKVYQISKQLDILLIQDGVNDVYYIKERYYDKILGLIANDVLSTYPKESILNSEESRKAAIAMQEYLEIKLNKLLSAITNEDIILKLIELHHSCQYWKWLTRIRFHGINTILSYIGYKYENQIESSLKYTETDNATCFLIENIIRKDYNRTNPSKPSYEDIDMLFAYAGQLYYVGIYLDLLTKRPDEANLEILSSGRVLFPTQEMEMMRHYFDKLRYDNFYRITQLEKKATIQYDINTSDELFLNAFLMEFGFEYSLFNEIITKCMQYNINNNEPIYCHTEKVFIETFFKDKNQKYYTNFKKHFVLSKEIAKNLPYKEFLPQRHNRIFQITTRPWIYYNDKIIYSFNPHCSF